MKNLWTRLPIPLFLGVGLSLFAVAWILGEIGRVAAYDEMPTPALLSKVEKATLAGAGQHVSKARRVVETSWPDDCRPDATTGIINLDDANCMKALNDATPFPATLKQVILSLRALKLTRAGVAAEAFAADLPSDAAPWQRFYGGKIVGELRNGGDALKSYREASFGSTASAIEGEGMLNLADRALKLSSSQADAAKAFGEGLKSHVFRVFARTMEGAALAVLFFLVMAVLLYGRRQRAGVARWLWSGAIFLLVVGVLVPDALAPLDLTAVKEGEGAKLGILDAPAVLGSQVFAFAAKAFHSVVGAGALLAALLLGTFALLFFGQTRWAIPVATYALLVLPIWREGDMFRDIDFSPFDPKAFDASLSLPLLVWTGELLATLLAVVLALGAWHVLGRRALGHAERLLDEHQ